MKLVKADNKSFQPTANASAEFKRWLAIKI